MGEHKKSTKDRKMSILVESAQRVIFNHVFTGMVLMGTKQGLSIAQIIAFYRETTKDERSDVHLYKLAGEAHRVFC